MLVFKDIVNSIVNSARKSMLDENQEKENLEQLRTYVYHLLLFVGADELYDINEYGYLVDKEKDKE